MKNIVISILVIITIVGIAIFRTLNTNNTNSNQGNNISGGVTDNSNDVNNCVITLFGDMYDVSTLIRIHPGGNIFECGTDMTNTFLQQHGNDLKRIEKYLVK